MNSLEQVRSYVDAYRWGGPTSALQLHHLSRLSRLIRPGDTVVDLACGPGPLLLELASLFPDVRFIGVDLSEKMLAHLQREAGRRRLQNLQVRLEDIRTVPYLPDNSVDVIVSTSALHHLPDERSLLQVFRRANRLLRDDGGFYFFDFCLLRSDAAIALCVKDVARQVSAVTAQDYHRSLCAAFPAVSVLNCARDALSRPFRFSTSAFIDFFYVLETRSRAARSLATSAYLKRRWRGLPPSLKCEHLMLRWLRQVKHVEPRKNVTSRAKAA